MKINEMSYFVSPKIKSILNEIPIVEKDEFQENVEIGDIILAFSPKEVLNQRTVRIITKTMATFQKSPYTTSKLALDNKTAIGYGIKLRDPNEADIVRKYPIKNLLEDREELCLLRVKEVNEKTKIKAAKFLVSKIGLNYNGSDLFKSIWEGFTRGKLFSFFKDEPLDSKELKNIQRPLFCSSIIALAYWFAGFKHRFNDRNPFTAWPKDFLLDEKTEKICRVEGQY